MERTIGFINREDTPITGFECTCKTCGSKDIKMVDEIQMGSEWTGMYGGIFLVCQGCNKIEEIVSI